MESLLRLAGGWFCNPAAKKAPLGCTEKGLRWNHGTKMVASQPQGKSAAAFSTVVKARGQGLTSLLERGVLAEDLTPGCKARIAFAVPASICGAGGS